jgi:eukaryotic-like serine/threonine-protein kinase
MTLQAARTLQLARSARPLVAPGLNRYHVLAELGRGGMGIVYKGLDTKLHRFVAIKVLPEECSRDEVARERFMHEARAASAIDHPNVCTIHDIGSTREGQRYIVMAYYEGETLKARLERSDLLETGEIVDIATQICRGLEAAHARGIVHRDIKPGNILLGRDGVVKVLDFGLARRFGALTHTETFEGLDTPGRPLGTASYMAPERILEMPLDPRSDIFSLGVLIYEMATRRRPFSGSSPAETVMNVLEMDPEPMTLICPSRPPWLERIVAKALSKGAKDRYQSAVDFRNSLLKTSGGSHESDYSERRVLAYGSR